MKDPIYTLTLPKGERTSRGCFEGNHLLVTVLGVEEVPEFGKLPDDEPLCPGESNLFYTSVAALVDAKRAEGWTMTGTAEELGKALVVLNVKANKAQDGGYTWESAAKDIVEEVQSSLAWLLDDQYQPIIDWLAEYEEELHDYFRRYCDYPLFHEEFPDA